MPDNSPTWPAGFDALTAAPAHHTLLLENHSVRVLNTRIEPGQTVPVHTHEWPAAYYVLSWGDIIRRDEKGEVLMDSKAEGVRLEPGSAVWAQPLDLHTVENVGTEALHIISVEIKPT